MTENGAHEYCKDCPGPLYFGQEYKHLFGKMEQMCIWKDKHETDQKQYREKRELKEQERNEDVDTKFGNLKSWAIVNLVAFIFILFGIIGVLVRQ